jgi:hypothetical protein
MLDIAVQIAAAALDPGALLGDLALEECAARLGALPARFVPGPGMVLGRADRALELLERFRIVVLQEMPDRRREVDNARGVEELLEDAGAHERRRGAAAGAVKLQLDRFNGGDELRLA